jgi:hypothetical protein
LQKANVQYEIESQAYRMQIKFMTITQENDRKEFEAALNESNKKWWKWFKVGLGAGLVIGTLIIVNIK